MAGTPQPWVFGIRGPLGKKDSPARGSHSAGGAGEACKFNGLDLPKVLSAPRDGTLFFAGEATVHDAQTGTAFGALESGLRAADEIIWDQLG
jgi:hypothetical protein